MTNEKYIKANRVSELASNDSPYRFVTEAEADVTFLIIAWFAITESAALGIFPLLSALEIAKKERTEYFGEFFEPGFQHFRDEQQHANMWCRALLDFVKEYPEVVKRVELPHWLLGVTLKNIGKPHSVLDFGVDCLAFELAMRALYDVTAPRLEYPPLAPIFRRIIADEKLHTDFDEGYVKGQINQLAPFKRFLKTGRFWRNLTGVVITLRPLLYALDKHCPMPMNEFHQRLTYYVELSGMSKNPKILKLLPAVTYPGIKLFGW
jgi:hypothetical protein